MVVGSDIAELLMNNTREYPDSAAASRRDSGAEPREPRPEPCEPQPEPRDEDSYAPDQPAPSLDDLSEYPTPPAVYKY